MSVAKHEAVEEKIANQIRETLAGRSELLKHSTYPLDHPLAGHCYVASEAFFHLTGGYDRWHVERVSVHVPAPHGDDEIEFTHWYLRERDSGTVYDLTKDQFTEYRRGHVEIPYSDGTRTGFLTEGPSERAQKVIDEVVHSRNA